jgi:DNA polymerase III subunit delta
MQVRPADLERHLGAGLAPIYLIAGDETLLVQECCEQILDCARGAGFAEREVVDVDKGYDWATLRQQTGSLSLFSRRRVFDLRVPPGQFGRGASDALREWLARPVEDTLLLIRSERLDGQQRNSAWFKAIERSGVVVLVWPVTPGELPAWLDQRCRRVGLRLERDALAFLAARVEGNLLAAVQEIEKLRMQELPSPIGIEAVRAAVADASHYDSFDALDAALAQQSRRLHHIVGVLRAEGVAPLNLLGAIGAQVQRLRTGAAVRMPQPKARVFESARARLSAHDLDTLAHLGAVVDQQVKGMREGDPWQTLETMLLLLAGESRLRPLMRNVDALRRFFV